jgi:PAS domain S-box-containing protein
MTETPDELSSDRATCRHIRDGEQLHALYDAVRRLARAERKAEIFGAVLDGARATTGCTAAAIYLPERSGIEQLLVLNAQAGAPWEAPPRIGGLWLTSLGRNTPTPVPNALDLAAPLHATAQLITLAGAGAPHGVLACVWGEKSARPQAWAEALADLAEDAGYALDRLQGRQAAAQPGEGTDARMLLTAMTALTDIGLLYGNLMDRLLSAIQSQILALLPLSGVAIYLYNDLSEQLELAEWGRGEATLYGPDPAALWEGQHRDECLALAQSVAQGGAPAVTTALEQGEENKASGLRGELRRLGAGNLVCVPLLAGGWLIGVLQAAAAPGREVSPAEVEVLRLLAGQAAVAIENARLFAQSRADQERSRAVVDATNDAILMLDEHRRPMIVNRRARFFFGLTERDLVGKSFEQLGNLFGRIFEDGQGFNGWLSQMLRSQSERAVAEFHILSPEPRLLQCYSAPVTDLQDRYLGRLLVFRDITREREVERMKSDFVSIVSHELRTPLTSIQGALQLVLGHPESGKPGMADSLPPRGRELLTISRSNTERLIRLINDILDIAKIEQGRIDLRREQVEPGELCRLAAAEMSALANGRGISVELQIKPWLPKVLADRDRSVQVLVNLLSNAIKFSRPGQRVLVSARHDGGMVSFTVQDWGRGIAQEDQAGLFQKFQQIDSSPTRDVGGTGLGLAISKALVEEQGGRMWLASEPGKGSSFSFTLPVAPGVADAGPQRPRVVIAEAAEPLRATLSAALAAQGWEPHEATSVEGLLAVAQAVEPALVVLGLPASAEDSELLQRLSAGAPLLLLSDRPPAEIPPAAVVVPRSTSPVVVAAQASRMRSEAQTHILVVDDDPYVRPVLVRLLQRNGLRVSSASEGYAALAAVEADRPDVILLDIKMPGLDGFEVLRRLKARPETAQIPVIVLTANDLSDTTRAQGIELGARAYLEKPIAYERLLSTIYAAIGPSEGPL